MATISLLQLQTIKSSAAFVCTLLMESAHRNKVISAGIEKRKENIAPDLTSTKEQELLACDDETANEIKHDSFLIS